MQPYVRRLMRGLEMFMALLKHDFIVRRLMRGLENKAVNQLTH